MRVFLLIMSVFIGLAGCNGNWNTYPKSESVDAPKPMVIRPGDTLDISVYNEITVSGSYEVSKMGDINLPLIGLVAVSKMTSQEAEKEIAATLKKQGYFVSPKVTVAFAQDYNVYILGEVLGSGEYPYRSGMTILDLAATAGGFSYRANQNKFDIIRKQADGSEVHILGDIATHVLPNDTIRVRERYF